MEAEILIVEIGGTVGDIEGEPFLETLRQMRMELGEENVLSVPSYAITVFGSIRGTQDETNTNFLFEKFVVREFSQISFCVERTKIFQKNFSKRYLDFVMWKKRQLFLRQQFQASMKVPLSFQKHGIAKILERKLKLKEVSPRLTEWRKMVDNIKDAKEDIKIALCGKYNELDDAYLSVIEATKAAAYLHKRKAEIVWIDTELIEKNSKVEWKHLKDCAGIIVPGGFGIRGTEGKIAVAKYAREKKIPYLGLCLGSQIMAIEYARNKCGIKDATSQEF